MRKEPSEEFKVWLKVFRKSRPSETELNNAFNALMEVLKEMNKEIEDLKAK